MSHDEGKNTTRKPSIYCMLRVGTGPSRLAFFPVGRTTFLDFRARFRLFTPKCYVYTVLIVRHSRATDSVYQE